MAQSRIQGQPLNVTVVGCRGLRNTSRMSRQNPYVCLHYANASVQTRTCKDNGTNPTFNDNFQFVLVEGLREINVDVWNDNTFRSKKHIARGRIVLEEVIARGLDYNNWSLLTRSGRAAGEIQIVLKFENAQRSGPRTYTNPPAPNIVINNVQENNPQPYNPPYPPAYPALTPLIHSVPPLARNRANAPQPTAPPLPPQPTAPPYYDY